MKESRPNIVYTVKHNLCCGCGICEGVCPTNAIKIVAKQGLFSPVVNASKCNNEKGCHRCYDVCPGLGFCLKEESQKVFEPDLQDDRLVGRYLKTYVGYSCDVDLRYHAASGGLITQFLIWLLDHNEIDGAVVTRFDKNSDYKVSTFIATTREELLSAKGSKYSPVTMSGIIRQLKAAEGQKYVVVGLPCHIQGFRKAEKKDLLLKNKIIGYFSIFCSSSRSFFFTEYLMKERNIALEKVEYLAYRDRGNQGGLVIQGDNFDYYQDYRKYCHPLKSIFVPRRCLFCADHFGEMADLSFGDINIKPYNEDRIGINSLIVRNSLWETKLLEAVEFGVIALDMVDIDVINKSQPSAKMKKGRNLNFVRLLGGVGRKVPEYDIMASTNMSIKIVIQYAMNRMQQYIGRHKGLWPIIKIIKSLSHHG